MDSIELDETPDVGLLEFDDAFDEAVDRNTASCPDNVIEEVPVSAMLPIDAHADAISSHVSKHRITVIQGETGCGKSSRLPMILLEAERQAGRQVRMMISQPRRIAARALVDRLSRGKYGELIGLRMGHGERIESKHTRIWFCTSGYVVQLIAHHPEVFAQHTHLIIDEVHERSVDSDLLCMLARRLLQQHPQLRLVIMSATIHTGLYSDYFDVPPEQTRFVGARRFPLRLHYADDMRADFPRMPSAMAKTFDAIVADCNSCARGQLHVPQRIAKLQYEAAIWIVQQLALSRTCGAALIFVSGMTDIVSLSESFELNNMAGDIHLKVLPIHSELPFEQQLEVFKPLQDNEFKVVVATNAAESSLTLPDCDAVICLGTHKQVERSHESAQQCQLVNSWIPKSSSTQRAGRTGRVRAGTVFRLYSRRLFDALPDHETPEVLRQPLAQLVLRLRGMMASSPEHVPVVPLIRALIEPPSTQAIGSAFESLHQFGLISSASDEGELTDCGSFVASLGVGIRCGRFISFALVLGVLPEAIVCMAALQLPRSPFRIATPLFHGPDEYNDIVTSTLEAQERVDGGRYSEPLMLMELYVAWQRQDRARRDMFCRSLGLSHIRMRQFDNIVRHLRQRVQGSLGRRQAIPHPFKEDATTSVRVVLLMRLLFVWTFYDQVLCVRRAKATKMPPRDAVVVESVTRSEVETRGAGGNGGAVATRQSLSQKQVQRIFRSASSVKAELGSVVRQEYKVANVTCSLDACRRSVCALAIELEPDLVEVASSDSLLLVLTSSLWAELQPRQASMGLGLQVLPSSTVGFLVPQYPPTPAHYVFIELSKPSKTRVNAAVQFIDSVAVSVARALLVKLLAGGQNHSKKRQSHKPNKSGASVVEQGFESSERQRMRMLGLNARWTLCKRTASQAIRFAKSEPLYICTKISPPAADITSLGAKILTSISRGYRGKPLVRVLDEWSPQKVDVVCKSPSSTWVMCKDLSGCSAKVLLPRCSLLEGTSFNVSTSDSVSSIYAVSADVMFIGADKSTARVSGVSVLPEGTKFLALALYCAEVSAASRLRTTGDKNFLSFIDAAVSVSEVLLPTVSQMSMKNHDSLALDIIELFEALRDNKPPPAHLLRTNSAPSRPPFPPPPTSSAVTMAADTDGGRQETAAQNLALVRLLPSDESLLQRLCLLKSGNRRYRCLACTTEARWGKCLKHMLASDKCLAALRKVLAQNDASAFTKPLASTSVEPLPLAVLLSNESMRKFCLIKQIGRGKHKYACPVCKKRGSWGMLWHHLGYSACWKILSGGAHGPDRGVHQIDSHRFEPSDKLLRQMCLQSNCTGKNVYACWTCGKRSNWERCLAHMHASPSCWSELVVEAKELAERQDAAPVAIPGTARAHATSMQSSQEESESERGQQISSTTTTSAAAKAASKVKAKSKTARSAYACLVCGTPFAKWPECLAHQEAPGPCLDELLAEQREERLAQALANLRKRCSVPRITKAGPPLYRCLNCGEQSSWSECRLHMETSACSTSIDFGVSEKLVTRGMQSLCSQKMAEIACREAST